MNKVLDQTVSLQNKKYARDVRRLKRRHREELAKYVPQEEIDALSDLGSTSSEETDQELKSSNRHNTSKESREEIKIDYRDKGYDLQMISASKSGANTNAKIK